jgi:ABC-type oligopeptide transport system substrate-binding subunit
MGKAESGTQTFSNVRESHGEVVDDLTIDFVCDGVDCHMLPRFAQFTVFQAPEWYQSLTDDERDARGEIIGWGPYKWKEWKRGESYKLERYED